MIEYYTGLNTDYFVIGIGATCLLLFVLYLINIVKYVKLKKRLNMFMTGKDVSSLEDTLIMRLEQIDDLIVSNNKNERKIEIINDKMLFTVNKFGLVKYDALDGMGGKLSFALAMLDEKENGFIMNCMHSREGSYTYIKEVINSNTIVTLSDEEQLALKKAIEKVDR